MLEKVADKFRDESILIARILLMLLFLIFGWKKLMDFHGTVGFMASVGAPLPEISAAIAIVMEFFVAMALLAGAWTRQLALPLLLYTLGTGIIGHHYWTVAGAARYDSMVNFYKNLGIMGGLLLLFVTGGGRYSITSDRS